MEKIKTIPWGESLTVVDIAFLSARGSPRSSREAWVAGTALAVGMCIAGVARAQDASQLKEIGVIVITSGQSSSLPTQIPTTTESVTAQQIAETINATDSEDALKYLPSLSVRKRFAGTTTTPCWQAALRVRRMPRAVRSMPMACRFQIL